MLAAKENGLFDGNWDGTDQVGSQCASGIYFICTDTAKGKISKKVILLH
jgi:hypothetical protein